jgi:hypothetical protein
MSLKDSTPQNQFTYEALIARSNALLQADLLTANTQTLTDTAHCAHYARVHVADTSYGRNSGAWQSLANFSRGQRGIQSQGPN